MKNFLFGAGCMFVLAYGWADLIAWVGASL